ncbi:uncharacterized protein [Musca autumnalis]|uniref:uncharacterized protein n=1 Tax=Musca autumnalis TaxID=221902 RepID=UPI003CEC5EC7
MVSWPFSKENPHKHAEPIQNDQLSDVSPVASSPPNPTLISHNFPKDFENKINTTKPYIFASLVTWPVYWLYRGLEWGRQRENMKLPMYIHRTYLHAKFLQIAIILTGVTVASMESLRHMDAKRSNSSR